MKTVTQRMVAYSEKNHSNDVLALINADRLPGQPFCTRDMLREAQRGHSKVDEGWWHKLEKPYIDVLMSGDEALGIVSFANHKTENEAYLLWLHARENRAVTTALVDHVVSATSQPNILAFHIASALTCGLEALPVRARASTHAVLLERGFAGEDLWRYMRFQARGGAERIDLHNGATVQEDASVNGWYIAIEDDGREVGFVSAGSFFEGIGVIWFIEVRPEFRRRGFGRKLLKTAMRKLLEGGVKEIITPNSERNKTAANMLYDSMGFREIDRLYSYAFRR